MTLSTADPGSKACWESSSCKKSIGAHRDCLLARLYVCVCLCVQCADVHFGVFRVTDPQTARVGQWIIW